MDNKKQCSKCKEFKPFNEFDRDETSKDGLSKICKDCRRKYLIEYLRKKRETLSKKYNKEIVNKIMGQKIWVGMTVNMARESWGRPDKINTSVSSHGVHEEWFYKNNKTYLYFDDGKLTSWESF
ncbi:hypothetical protein DRQ09_02965 [candidate division KSB1 bacterium]|nr:MAG: hypothetical protein DRQ09_02965 [candidate division KSB1 bacterium]